MYSEGEIIYHFPLTTQLGQEYQQDIPVAKAKKFRFDFAQAPEETGPGSPDTLPDLDFPRDQRREPAPGPVQLQDQGPKQQFLGPVQGQGPQHQPLGPMDVQNKEPQHKPPGQALQGQTHQSLPMAKNETGN